MASSFIEDKLQKNGIPGIVSSHGDIIFYLMKTDSLTKSEIAAKINKDKATVTALIKKLEDLNIVVQKKSETDNRFTHISLTPYGRSLEKIFLDISEELFSIVYKDINKEDKAIFFKVLCKVRENLKESK